LANNPVTDIGVLFRPRAVAVVGASGKPGNQGRAFVEAMSNPRFKGDLYAVHPSSDLPGHKTYRRVSEIPGPVDHVIISVPAQAVTDVIKDCGKKGVRSAAIFSSGFAEEGTPEGKALQEELVKAARKANVRIIGPNCMGFYCPSTGLSFRQDHPMREGPLGFISQSGGVCMTGIFMADSKGLGFSKAVSYGNESDLGSAELLRYMADDDETRVILLYVEGVPDGAKFLKALKYASARKPVVMLKGGLTAGGTKAVSSHTGAMAGSGRMWEAAAAQANVPVVPSMDELIDSAQAFARLKKPGGNRVGLITISGGFGVFATDILCRAGLETPAFSPDTEDVLTRLVKRPGTSIKNPLDMAVTFFHMKKYPRLFGALDEDPGIDQFVVLLAVEYLTYLDEEVAPWANMFINQLLEAFGKMKKPVSIVFFQTTFHEKRIELEKMIHRAGFPVFPTVERCADAINRIMRRAE